MFTKIDHLALHVKNLQTSVTFYKTLFGFEEVFQNTLASGLKIVYLKLGETQLELLEVQQGETNGGHFCLLTDDFPKAYAGLVQKGVKVLLAPHPTAARTPAELGWSRAFFLGPDGEQIEIRGK